MRYFNVLVGPMSSGKTTFARRFWPEASRVHHILDERPPGAVEGRTPTEALRAQATVAWNGLKSATRAWLELDENESSVIHRPCCFVADGLFMSRQSRQAVADLIPRDVGVRTIAWFLDTPVQTIIKRFRARVDAGEFKSVPRQVLIKQCLCFELPSPDEPFDMWVRVPVPDQSGSVSAGDDPLDVMRSRIMFTDGNPIPKCDLLDEASSVGEYVFRDMEAR